MQDQSTYSFMYESSDLRDGETLREYRARVTGPKPRPSWFVRVVRRVF